MDCQFICLIVLLYIARFVFFLLLIHINILNSLVMVVAIFMDLLFTHNPNANLKCPDKYHSSVPSHYRSKMYIIVWCDVLYVTFSVQTFKY